jgi:hypothetical protein
MAADDTAVELEPELILRRRYEEALEAGLSEVDALWFAEFGGDIGVLRQLVRGSCSVELIRRIVL